MPLHQHAVKGGGDETAVRAAGQALCSLRTAGPDFEAVRHQLNREIEAADEAYHAEIARMGPSMA
jgi:hypothetical protein